MSDQDLRNQTAPLATGCIGGDALMRLPRLKKLVRTVGLWLALYHLGRAPRRLGPRHGARRALDIAYTIPRDVLWLIGHRWRWWR